MPATVDVDGRRLDCTLVDLSEGGATLAPPVPGLPVGGRGRVSVFWRGIDAGFQVRPPSAPGAHVLFTSLPPASLAAIQRITGAEAA